MTAPRRRALGLALGLALAAAAAGACTDPAPADGPGVTSRVARLEIPMFRNGNLDLLFVIDSSPAIAPQRAKLIASYRRFIEVLESFRGGLPDLHIGVVTADLGTRGADDPSPGPAIGTGPGSCTSEGDAGELRRAASIDGSFISDLSRADGTRARNYTGSLADAFVQLADAGEAGCTYVRPLAAARQALSGIPANAGFLRDDAYLGVVLLTNDDDCSFASSSFTGGQLDRSRCAASGELATVDRYVASLKALKPDPDRVLVAGAFLPPAAPACADARPAPRLDALLDAFPNRSRAVSICEPDLAELMMLFIPLIHPIGPPCFGAPLLDTDPVAGGLQPECAAWYRHAADGDPVEEILPACQGDAPGPCYRIHRDPVSCLGGGEALELRDGRRTLQATAIVECVSR